MTTYDSRGMDWDTWCALMCEMFAAQQLEAAPEERWQDWANGLTNIGYFSQNGVPDSRAFETWQDWAQSLVGIMNVE